MAAICFGMLFVDCGEDSLLLLLACFCTDPNAINPDPGLSGSGALVSSSLLGGVVCVISQVGMPFRFQKVKKCFGVRFGNVTDIYHDRSFYNTPPMLNQCLFSTLWVTWGCQAWLCKTWRLCTSFLCLEIAGRGVAWKMRAEGKERAAQVLNCQWM